MAKIIKVSQPTRDTGLSKIEKIENSTSDAHRTRYMTDSHGTLLVLSYESKSPPQREAPTDAQTEAVVEAYS